MRRADLPRWRKVKSEEWKTKLHCARATQQPGSSRERGCPVAAQRLLQGMIYFQTWSIEATGMSSRYVHHDGLVQWPSEKRKMKSEKWKTILRYAHATQRPGSSKERGCRVAAQRLLRGMICPSDAAYRGNGTSSRYLRTFRRSTRTFRRSTRTFRRSTRTFRRSLLLSKG